jgi:hypothetical protein
MRPDFRLMDILFETFLERVKFFSRANDNKVGRYGLSCWAR